MNFQVKCSDGHYVNVPNYAVKYSFFFHQYNESLKDDYLSDNNNNVNHEDTQKIDENKKQFEMEYDYPNQNQNK